jgi:hypothetical protein
LTPTRNMRTLGLTTFLLVSVLAALAQSPEQPTEKAPPEVEAALRARVTQFYDDFVAAKFKDAYLLVAEDSQDRFFQMGKQQYKSCELDLVQFSGRATKALVITKCKGDWLVQGRMLPVTLPIRSNWALIDGQWYWHYERPTTVQSPFSASGWVPVPPASKDGSAPLLPKDFGAVTQGILSRVSVDKTSVRFSSNQPSQEVVHVRNDMPGEVSLNFQDPGIRGLKVSVGATKLQAHQGTEVVFAWSPDNSAKTPPSATVQLSITPTNQTFPIAVTFESGVPAAAPQK